MSFGADIEVGGYLLPCKAKAAGEYGVSTGRER